MQGGAEGRREGKGLSSWRTINTFRETCTFHRGTVFALRKARRGNRHRNLFMIGSHVGDMTAGWGRRRTLVNGRSSRGHVPTLDDGLSLSVHSAVQQRVRIGRLAMRCGPLFPRPRTGPPFVAPSQGYNCVTP